MIIDDEKSIRNLLKLTISWKELGLEVVGEASSGIEAINSIDDIRPDIVFVDIRMPFMNGIEFSKLAIKRYPRLKIIILTAFNEFEYAKECIGIGVAEYLLKPIVRNDVNEACKKVIEQLNKMKPEKDTTVTEECNDIAKIYEYIQKNYSDPELNLTSIAQEFGFNSSYLSRRFKADIGINLIDYITKCRMEKAMECVKMKKLMYITAKEVGIPDPNYFGKCFKKYTGKSYSDVLKENSQK
jgi:YesN/AraC family two-component response regulator